VLALTACDAAHDAPEPHAQARAALSAEADVDPPVTGVAAVRQADLAMAVAGTQWLAVWSDQRMSNTGGWQVWGTRVSSTGVVLDPLGKQFTYGRGGDHPAVACTPAYCWVAWVDYNSFEGVRMASNGTLLDATVVSLSSSVGVMSDLSLATNGTDFFAAWTDTASGVPAIKGKALNFS